VLVSDLYWIGKYGLEGSGFHFLLKMEETLAAFSGREPSIITVFVMWFMPVVVLFCGFVLINTRRTRRPARTGR